MSNVLKLSGPIKVGSLAADPSNPQEGFIYFNTTTGDYRFYENGAFRVISAEDLAAVNSTLTAHLNGGAGKHDATEVDYERADGSKKNIQAASDDVETALTDLDDAIGALDATPTNYTPTDPTIVADHLAAIDSALANTAPDASDVTYTPSSLVSWTSATDPGNTDDALDQLASRISGAENTLLGKASLGQVSEIDTNVNDLITLTGVAENVSTLGTFTGSTITDSSTIKTALQELETEVETKAADADVIKKDGSVAFTGNQSLGGNKITSLGTPTATSDAATKGYVDSALEGLKPKEAVRVATTAPLALATAFEDGDTLDGVTLATGDRVLIKDQTDASENGIYTVNASGAPTRATDFDSVSPIDEINGALVGVREGTANAGKVFVQSSVIGTIDTDDINFVFFNSASSLVGGDGVTVSGSNVSVDHDGEGLTFSSAQLALELDGSTLSKSETGVKVADGGIGDTQVASGISATKIGNGDVDNTELSYVNGVTSAIQTQLNGKLANVVEDTTPQLGGALDTNGNAILHDGDGIKRGNAASASNLIQEEYIDSIALSGSQTNTVISDLTFAHASFEGMEIVYKIKETTSNDVRIGTMRIVTNGTAVVLNDIATETADTGITFSAIVNGSNINIRYSSGTNGATMRADVKRIRA